MKFELSDETVLKVSALGSAAVAAHTLIAPRDFQNTYMTPSALAGGLDGPALRWFGGSLVHWSISDAAIAISDDASRDAKKKALTASGIGWACCASICLADIHNGVQKKGMGYATVAGQATISALCLWRGLKDESSGTE